jgi:hypothetical protein
MTHRAPDEPPRPLDDLTLTVQVEGDRHEAVRLYVIGRPAAGRVHVREWRGEDWTAGPLERDVDAADLLAEIERAHQQRRRVSEEMYRVRHWLQGTAL